jgi:hypothetical protein
MHRLEVGQPYPVHLPESVQYNYRGGQHELLMVMGRLTEEEVAAVRSGPCDFGLLVSGPVIFFLYRFGDEIPWSDAPYSLWLVPASERVEPPTEWRPDTRALLTVILVEQESAIVRVLRAVTFSPEFTMAIHGQIWAQATMRWRGRERYDRTISEAYGKWPHTSDMIRDAQAITKGGE